MENNEKDYNKLNPQLRVDEDVKEKIDWIEFVQAYQTKKDVVRMIVDRYFEEENLEEDYRAFKKRRDEWK